ncbi:MAG: peptidyl-alpha-hydroxyglycine alpha-amidating lyase family protein [Candidatus Cyclobacteriaceae bacterium M3_2C_046]
MRFRVFILLIFLINSDFLFGQEVKELQYKAVDDFFRLPQGWLFGEATAIEVNSKGHIFVFNRGDHKLIEFDEQGNFIKEIGAGNETFAVPHGLKIDHEDNIWTTDIRNHIIIKFSPAGEVLMVLGRKGIAGEFMGKWNYSTFNEPTDVAIAPNGDIFVSDGYKNSRVVKFNHKGELLKTWGEAGDQPGQFKIPHTITVHNDKVYVGDRENKRIQIFDTEGNFLDQWTNTGYPYSIKISDNQLYTIDGVDCKLYKFDLEGNKLGEFGVRGFASGEMSLPHWIDITDNNELFVAEVLSWRFQKFVETQSRLKQ